MNEKWDEGGLRMYQANLVCQAIFGRGGGGEPNK